jgi:hypothetical protein
MKRHPQIPAVESAASIVEAGAALIELAVHESKAPVDALSGALERMTKILSGVDAAPVPREQLAREVAICIESLQFHDRLSQQLLQVRNILASLVANGLLPDESGQTLSAHPHDRAVGTDPQSWPVLLENLRARFTTESHRMLFNLLIPASGSRSSAPALRANEGSIELF